MYNNRYLLLILLHLIVVGKVVNSAKILVIITSPSPSHNIFFQPLIEELSLRGHQTVSITPYPINKPQLINLTEINISKETNQILNVTNFLQHAHKQSPFDGLKSIILNIAKLSDVILENHYIQNAIRNEKFDLLMVEFIWASALYNLRQVFNCPLIGITSFDILPNVMNAIGNPPNPNYYVDTLTHVGNELTFGQRFDNFWHLLEYNWVYYWKYLPIQDTILAKHFGDLQKAKYKTSWELEQSVDLLLIDYNPIFHPARPLVPNVIPIGGLHTQISNKQIIEKELQDFLDNSKKGVIYMSLGSNIKSANLPKEVIEIFLDVFKSMPYNVIWKWENRDVLPKTFDEHKIFIQKWLPQRAILDHPHVKLFIMQGGIQSIDEAIKSKIPLIGIPFGGDQQYNTERISQLKIGHKIQLQDLSTNKLKKAIDEILTNKEYKNNIIKISNLLSDQETKPLDRSIWWIEYVLRHGGAQHLRCPGANLPWYKFLMLDIIFFLIVSFIFVIVIILLLFHIGIKYFRLYFLKYKIKIQ